MENDFNKNLDYEFNEDMGFQIVVPSRRNYLSILLVIITAAASVVLIINVS
jgi:hypothetical protein